MSAMGAAQDAIHAKLTGTTAFMALVTGVFDHTPQNTAYPYVVIGEFTEIPEHRHDRNGWGLTGMIHIWDDALGFKRAQQILAQLDAALLHQRLTMAGWGVSKITREFTETRREREDDRELRRVITRWRVNVMEIPS